MPMANAPMRVFIARSHVETLLRYGVSSEHVDVTDVNVIHVLYEYICHRLYTRMRAWVYVYLPGSGAPESASARRPFRASRFGSISRFYGSWTDQNSAMRG